MFPACCHPLWEREGVTLQTVDKKKRIIGEKKDFNKAEFSGALWIKKTIFFR
jgi:hypothetical protein